MMPRLDGVELCRRLRSDPLTASLPVIMLTAKSLSVDKVVGLTAGADDYIIKPFDTLELVARVRSTLRRNAEMRAVSPLTGLPGNQRINEEIAARAAGEAPIRGLPRRPRQLQGLQRLLRLDPRRRRHLAARDRVEDRRRRGPEPPPFIGHVGGDDFVVICGPDQVEELTNRVLRLFDDGVLGLHDPEDVANGYIPIVDRQGNERRFPLTSVSIGVAMTGRRQFRDHREIVAVATEMKAVAKGIPGSAVAIDRRTDQVPEPAVEPRPIAG